jgi:glucose-1-phosphate adenylyltransferase
MNTDEENKINEFVEKPKNPISNKASMGIYIFKWKKLRKYLMEDQISPNSSNDFGKDIIPKMLADGEQMYAFPFKGYWRDVGTIQSLWEANMDLLEEAPELDLYDPGWRIYSRNPVKPPHFIALGANVRRCIITEGGVIYGDVYHSVLFSGVIVGRGSKIHNSILMPNVKVGENTIIENAIIAENTIIGDNCYIGYKAHAEEDEMIEVKDCDITVVGENLVLPTGYKLDKGIMIDADNYRAYLAVV